MARTPLGSVSMHRPCASTGPVRVRGDPTLDPTPAHRGRGLRALRCVGKRSSLGCKACPSREPPEWRFCSDAPRPGAPGPQMLVDELIQTPDPVLLLEREAELAALEAVLGAARAGDGRLVVVEGNAGIGKTRLLAEARQRATDADFEVLTARGGELEGEFAFGIVRQLFEFPLAALSADELSDLFAGAAGLSSPLFASAPAPLSSNGAESPFAMLHGLYWLAANFAGRRPTLVVVDDLHWADEPSLRWLAYLARRLEGLQLLLLLGTRPSGQANTPELTTALIADPAAVVMRPGTLGPTSAAALARRRLGA